MRYFAAIVLFAASLAACQPPSSKPSMVPADQASEARAEAPTAALASPTEEPEAPAEPATQASTEVPQVRQELSASDPGSVNLASGKPTLVEFFAFW